MFLQPWLTHQHVAQVVMSAYISRSYTVTEVTCETALHLYTYTLYYYTLLYATPVQCTPTEGKPNGITQSTCVTKVDLFSEENGENGRRQLAFVAEVIHEDDLMQQLGRRAIDDAVDGAHQRGPTLVVEDDDHRRARQVHWVIPVLTPVERREPYDVDEMVSHR